MPYLGWASLGGTELINSVRAYAYAAGAGITAVVDPGVPELPAIVGDGTRYLSPVADPAPWFDPAVPASSRFLGVLGLAMVGISNQRVLREPVETVTGVRIGAPRYGVSEAEVEVYLVALDEEGLTYGLGFLASVLRGTPCDGECGGQALCLFSGRPVGDGAAQRRYRLDAGVLAGITVQERHRLRGGVGARATFTLVFGSPYAYAGPVVSFPSMLLSSGVLQATDPAALVCPDTTAPVVDPAMSLPEPPPATPLPADPAYPVTAYQARALYVEASLGTLPAWSEVVPVVTVRTGASAMRRVLVRVAPRLGGRSCAASMEESACTAAGDVGVAYLPPESVAVFDGRTGRQWVETVELPPRYGRSVVRDVNGGPPRWPVVQCPAEVCVRVSAVAGGFAADASVAVELWARSDVA
jgi:hypothetical protein